MDSKICAHYIMRNQFSQPAEISYSLPAPNIRNMAKELEGGITGEGYAQKREGLRAKMIQHRIFVVSRESIDREVVVKEELDNKHKRVVPKAEGIGTMHYYRVQ